MHNLQPVTWGQTSHPTRGRMPATLVLGRSIDLTFAVRRKSRKRRIVKARAVIFRRNPMPGVGLERKQAEVLLQDEFPGICQEPAVVEPLGRPRLQARIPRPGTGTEARIRECSKTDVTFRADVGSTLRAAPRRTI